MLGKYSPSGKLPITIAKRREDYCDFQRPSGVVRTPSPSYFPKSVTDSDSKNSKNNEKEDDLDHVKYDEDIFVGQFNHLNILIYHYIDVCGSIIIIYKNNPDNSTVIIIIIIMYTYIYVSQVIDGLITITSSLNTALVKIPISRPILRSLALFHL